jgi:hypothetical protein
MLRWADDPVELVVGLQKFLSVTLLRVDTRRDRVLRIDGPMSWNARQVMPLVSNFRLAPPRRLRGLLALFVLTMYLIGGVLHGLCDLDVTNTSGGVVISLAEKAAGHTDKGVVADHHCHGCFSVFVPAPVMGAVETMAAAKVDVLSDIGHSGLPPGIDPPPPKFLT